MVEVPNSLFVDRKALILLTPSALSKLNSGSNARELLSEPHGE